MKPFSLILLLILINSLLFAREDLVLRLQEEDLNNKIKLLQKEAENPAYSRVFIEELLYADWEKPSTLEYLLRIYIEARLTGPPAKTGEEKEALSEAAILLEREFQRIKQAHCRAAVLRFQAAYLENIYNFWAQEGDFLYKLFLQQKGRISADRKQEIKIFLLLMPEIKSALLATHCRSIIIYLNDKNLVKLARDRERKLIQGFPAPTRPK